MAAGNNKPYLPSFWEDNSKMTAFFSPLLSKTANPEGVASKMNLWKQCINQYCQFNNKASFTNDEILKAFSGNNRTPQCIQAVFDDMAKSGEIFEMGSYLKMKPVNKLGWSAWALELGKMPVYWTLNKVKNSVWPASPATFQYVHKKTLQDKAENLLKNSPCKGEICQISDLNNNSDLAELLLVIHWLVIIKKAAVYDYDINVPSKMLVKLSNIDEPDVTISEKDVCKYNLLKTIKQIEDRIADYEAKSDKAREEARKQLQKNCKSLAMCQLKKKKRYEEIINQQANVLNNFHGLLETLNQAEANQEIFETLKNANAAIKNMHKEKNLNEESVSEVMDDVRDTIETLGDIDSALSQSVLNDNNEELEKELEGLMKEKAAEDELCKWMDQLKLPDLPEPKLVKPAVTVPNASE